jgi:hypothetical protein
MNLRMAYELAYELLARGWMVRDITNATPDLATATHTHTYTVQGSFQPSATSSVSTRFTCVPTIEDIAALEGK